MSENQSGPMSDPSKQNPDAGAQNSADGADLGATPAGAADAQPNPTPSEETPVTAEQPPQGYGQPPVAPENPTPPYGETPVAPENPTPAYGATPGTAEVPTPMYGQTPGAYGQTPAAYGHPTLVPPAAGQPSPWAPSGAYPPNSGAWQQPAPVYMGQTGPAPATGAPKSPPRWRKTAIAGAAGLVLALVAGGAGGLVGYELHGDNSNPYQSAVSTNGNAPVVDRSSLATIAARVQPERGGHPDRRRRRVGCGHLVRRLHRDQQPRGRGRATATSVQVTFNERQEGHGEHRRDRPEDRPGRGEGAACQRADPGDLRRQRQRAGRRHRAGDRQPARPAGFGDRGHRQRAATAPSRSAATRAGDQQQSAIVDHRWATRSRPTRRSTRVTPAARWSTPRVRSSASTPRSRPADPAATATSGSASRSRATRPTRWPRRSSTARRSATRTSVSGSATGQQRWRPGGQQSSRAARPTRPACSRATSSRKVNGKNLRNSDDLVELVQSSNVGDKLHADGHPQRLDPDRHRHGGRGTVTDLGNSSYPGSRWRRNDAPPIAHAQTSSRGYAQPPCATAGSRRLCPMWTFSVRRSARPASWRAASPGRARRRPRARPRRPRRGRWSPRPSGGRPARRARRPGTASAARWRSCHRPPAARPGSPRSRPPSRRPRP